MEAHEILYLPSFISSSVTDGPVNRNKIEQVHVISNNLTF